jgi:hypothetical protein
MFRRHLAKAVVFLCSIAAVLSVNETCLAAQGTGKISVYLVNGAVQNRGACVQLVPALQGTWACTYSNNYLYDELNSLLHDAYLYQKTCLINYETSNYYITWVECYP